MKNIKKYAFITGASGGIGSATARLFAEKGWLVGLTDIDRDALEALCGEIGREKARGWVADISDADSIASALKGFAAWAGGRMDVLVNCAGLLYAGHFEEIPIGRYRKIVEVNLLGMIHCIHAAVPLLEKSGQPCIVNLSSASALYGIPGLAVYSATKFAVRGLSEALNIELRRKGIMVCDIMPGFVRTKMLENASNELHLKERESLLSAEEVAATVWKASQGKRLHWPLGREIRLLSALIAFLPVALRKSIAIRGSRYLE